MHALFLVVGHEADSFDQRNDETCCSAKARAQKSAEKSYHKDVEPAFLNLHL